MDDIIFHLQNSHTPQTQQKEIKPIPPLIGTPLPTQLLNRELGINNRKSRKRHHFGDFDTVADFNLCKTLGEEDKRRRFSLPQNVRTTFHMAFSNDGKLVASTHGDHNIYICDVSTGTVLRVLSGHPRTPWCVVFHPTQHEILASGCLAGHVRVWDLKGGSELLVTETTTVIASLAFHPGVRLLAVGTSNEVVFWDWSRGGVALARITTNSPREKLRLVRFTSDGKSLLTGITNSALDFEDPEEILESRQDRFQESYRQLVSHYEDLVQHYHTFLQSRIPRLLGEGATVLSTNESPMEPRPGPSRPNSSDLRQNSSFSSIEALAQNILEMQNLCSQARARVRLAPPSVETEHVAELQQIRQHLEVLQDQTRRLQTSIRATLTSLATGSLAVLRGQEEITMRRRIMTTDRMRVPPVTNLSSLNDRPLVEFEPVPLEVWPSGVGHNIRSWRGVGQVTRSEQRSNSRDEGQESRGGHGGEERWQRHFLSGVGLVPSAVREGRRPSAVTTPRRRSRLLPNRLNSSFTRSFYIRAEGDLIPVYALNNSSQSPEIRDALTPHVFIFPVVLFFPDFEPNVRLGIYYPPTTPPEEIELLDMSHDDDSRILTTSTSGRVRIAFDSTSLDLEVGGVRLGFVGINGRAVVESISSNFYAPGGGAGSNGGGRGVVYSNSMIALLGVLSRFWRTGHRRVTMARDAPTPAGGPGRIGGAIERGRGYFISQFDQGEERVLSLAVETAASELLRGGGRPVESRIERVLNGGFISGGGTGPGGGSNSVGTDRAEDIQRRIHFLAQWRGQNRGDHWAPPQQPSSSHIHIHLRRPHNHTPRRNNNVPSQSPSSSPRTEGSSARTRTNDEPRPQVQQRVRLPRNQSQQAQFTAAAATLEPSATTSRIQKWDFSRFLLPELSEKSLNVITSHCSLHSDACLDVSNDDTFIAVLQPSDSGAFSSVGVYSIKNSNLGELLYNYDFDQNTVSISISASRRFLIVGYAGRFGNWRIGQGRRGIGQILSMTPTGLQTLNEITTSSSHLLAINCMHFLPVAGLGVVYGSNTGELVLLQ